MKGSLFVGAIFPLQFVGSLPHSDPEVLLARDVHGGPAADTCLSM